MTTWHLVTGDAPPGFTGGVSTWVERICRGLSERGVEVVLWARGARLRGRAREARHDARFPVPVRRLRTRRWNRHQAAAVAEAVPPSLRAGDVVLASTWPLAPGLIEPCRALGVPLLVAAHGSEISRLAEAPQGLRALAGSARFAAVSGFLARQLEGLGLTAVVLPAPVPLDPDPPGAPQRSGLLVVARATPLKGIDRALRLAEALGWPATVVGEGPCLAELRRLASTLAVPVHFAGRLGWEETAARYRRAALVAQLSRVDQDGSGAEGLGLVVLEAMAHGAPAVVSDVGGLPEAVGPGLVLERPDDPQHSAAAIRSWLAAGDPAEQQRAWLAEEHGVQRCLEALLALGQEGRA